MAARNRHGNYVPETQALELAGQFLIEGASPLIRAADDAPARLAPGIQDLHGAALTGNADGANLQDGSATQRLLDRGGGGAPNLLDILFYSAFRQMQELDRTGAARQRFPRQSVTSVFTLVVPRSSPSSISQIAM